MQTGSLTISTTGSLVKGMVGPQKFTLKKPSHTITLQCCRDRCGLDRDQLICRTVEDMQTTTTFCTEVDSYHSTYEGVYRSVLLHRCAEAASPIWLLAPEEADVYKKLRQGDLSRPFHPNIAVPPLTVSPWKNDRLGKFRSFLTYLAEKFRSACTPHGTVTVDESMVKFKGRLAGK